LICVPACTCDLTPFVGICTIHSLFACMQCCCCRLQGAPHGSTSADPGHCQAPHPEQEAPHRRALGPGHVPGGPQQLFYGVSGVLGFISSCRTLQGSARQQVLVLPGSNFANWK
jgi:hypothetical protein